MLANQTLILSGHCSFEYLKVSPNIPTIWFFCTGSLVLARLFVSHSFLVMVTGRGRAFGNYTLLFSHHLPRSCPLPPSLFFHRLNRQSEKRHKATSWSKMPSFENQPLRHGGMRCSKSLATSAMTWLFMNGQSLLKTSTPSWKSVCWRSSPQSMWKL